MKKNIDVQLLRGIAVISVILFHAKEDAFKHGYLGVDVFFVISGFVITPQLLKIFQGSNPKIALVNFYKKRFMRLIPALGCTLSISAIFIFIFGNYADITNFALQGIFSTLLVGNIGATIFAGDYFSPTINPLIHTWSLSVEEQIYILLPILMLITFNRSRKKNSRLNWKLFFIFLFFTSFSIFTISNLVAKIYLDNFNTNSFDYLFYMSIPRIWEFMAGGLVSLYMKNKTFKFEISIKFVFLAIILILIFGNLNISSILLTCLVVIGTSCILMFKDSFGTNLFFSLLIWTGDRSYSIYLVHMPLLYLCGHAPGINNIAPSRILLVLTLMLVFLLGHLQYIYIEEKYRIKDLTHKNNSQKNIPKVFFNFVATPIMIFLVIFLLIQVQIQNKGNEFYSNKSNSLNILRSNGCIDNVFDSHRCTFNVSESKGTVLLVGDSQAYSAANGIRLAVSNLSMNFVGTAASGCPFLGIETSGNKPIDCLKFQDSVFDYISKNKPKLVIIANRTSGYMSSTENWRRFKDSSGNEVTDPSKMIDLYSSALRNTVSRISKSGSKVLLFQNIPEPVGEGYPKSFFQEFILRKKYEKSISITESFNSDARKFESSLEGEGLISLYDPYNEICKFDCNGEDFIERMYLDNFHLSVYGSESLYSSVQDKITRMGL